MSVIVFGPTGNIASVAARTAQEYGAKVFLAMRDPKKAIPGINDEQERTGGFERVQADLMKADTVSAAVKTTKAKRAFIYRAHGTSDAMKSTAQALKSSGIDFVVFLSSFTIQGESADVPSSEIIPYIHAQVENSLDEVYGLENYVALRPGGFATNLLRFKPGIIAGEVKLFGAHYKLDGITPEDIGRVSGIILAQGPKNGQRKVYLYGPQVLMQKDAIAVVGKMLGKDIKVSDVSEQEGREQFTNAGIPKPVADYMVRKIYASKNEDSSSRVRYDEGVANVHFYTGQPATKFQDWVEANKELFST